MTLRTSAVAVCRSSASCVSLKSRAFWIAITAWSAKVFRSAASLSLNATGGKRTTWIVPMPRPAQNIGAISIEKLGARLAISRIPSGTPGPFRMSG